jgi:uncharacterized protein YndB with AHSA1/START domain
MQKNITHNFFFQNPPAIVWEYLTTAELMAQWLMPNDFLPIIGHDFQFRIPPIPSLEIDGIIYCKVLEMVPPKKLTYSWKSGPGGGKITLDSIVTWELKEKEGGTALFLEHSGFGAMENLPLYAAMNNGWAQNIQKIMNLINASKNGSTDA